MKLLLDHDVPETIARTLARAGHQVERLRDVLAVTVRDDEVLKHAHEQASVLHPPLSVVLADAGTQFPHQNIAF